MLLAPLALLLLTMPLVQGFIRPMVAPAYRPRRSSLYAHKLTIKTIDGKVHEVMADESVSILDAALDANVDLPHSCKLGTCLACAAKVISGNVDQTGTTLDDSVIEKGFALTCSSYARSDVTIESIPEDELIDVQFAYN